VDDCCVAGRLGHARSCRAAGFVGAGLVGPCERFRAAYAERREGLLSALEAEAPARFSAYSSLGAGEKATALVSDSFWGEGDWLVGSLVASYVYACWQKRCEILHPEHTASGPPTQREVDGLAAMA
jgi:hypothetical protein